MLGGAIRERRSSALGVGVALAAALMLGLALASAAGADSLYWSNFEGNSIAHASLLGGEGGGLATVPVAASHPDGTAIDAATGVLYWANFSNDTIDRVGLDGSEARVLNTNGASIDHPAGLVLDTTLGRIYWANVENNTISYADLDGTGGGDLKTAGAPVARPFGVAIDPAAGRIYWANEESSTIGFANLDGSGEGGELNVSGALIENPDGLAIDPDQGRVYWANYPNGGSVGYANLSGGEGGQLNTSGAELNQPGGVAIDPATRELYVGNDVGPQISVISLSGGGARFDTSGATVNGGVYPAILERPLATSGPSISGTASLGSALSCGGAAWAGDLPESMLYRSPQTVTEQWLRDGQAIPGATGASVVASEGGAYTCAVTATNGAGATTSTSSAIVIARLELFKAKLNVRTGAAVLSARVSGAGNLTLTGKNLSRQSASAKGAGVVKLIVKAKGRAKKLLAKSGKAKVDAKVVFAPLGAAALEASKTIVLRRRLPTNRTHRR
jgi:Low-density lipoprotein receptor repeat class B